MRVLPVLSVLAMMLLAPATASAQKTIYLCTPTKQIVRVVDGQAVTTAVTPANSFDDPYHECVLGPDGLVYIASGNKVIKRNPQDFSTPTGASALVATLPSAAGNARGLAFNQVGDKTVLFINSASGGVFTFPLGGSLSNPAAIPLTSSGGGVVFGVEGNLFFASGANLRMSEPFYSSSSALQGPGGNQTPEPIGVAVNACGEAVVADFQAKKIRRQTANGPVDITGLTFTGNDKPLYLEIDASNQMYIVTAGDTAGKNAKLWRASFPIPDTSANPDAPWVCSASTVKTAIVTLQNIQGLPSDAIGVALGPTHHSITQTFGQPELDGSCSRDFNFGYHMVSYRYFSCPQGGFSLKIAAFKSIPSQVGFDPGTFHASTKVMRYSPEGAFGIQYLLLNPADIDCDLYSNQLNQICDGALPPTGVPPFLAKYSFSTQETINTPGVARHPDEDPLALYTDDVGNEYWELRGLGFGFDPGGERGDVYGDGGYSKRVVFNTGLALSNCAPANPLNPFEQPLDTGNPQFNGGQSGQNVKISIPINGPSTCFTQGHLFVSVAKIDGSQPVFMPVVSTSNQVGNEMSVSGQKFVFNLDINGYAPGTYQITVWGNILPVNGPNASSYTQKTFVVQ